MRLILNLVFITILLERLIFTFKQKEKKGQIKYKNFTIILVLSYAFCILLALFEFFKWNREFNIAMTLIGLLIVMGGIILRRISIKTLKDNWSIHIKDIPEQQMIISGPYKWVRHPYYDAVILELTGISLYLNSFLSLSYLFCIHLPLLLMRIREEEKFLINKFQKRYEEYRRKTGVFLPKL